VVPQVYTMCAAVEVPLAIVAVLGIVPLVGLSLVIVLLDYFVLSHPGLKRIFS